MELKLLNTKILKEIPFFYFAILVDTQNKLSDIDKIF